MMQESRSFWIPRQAPFVCVALNALEALSSSARKTGLTPQNSRLVQQPSQKKTSPFTSSSCLHPCVGVVCPESIVAVWKAGNTKDGATHLDRWNPNFHRHIVFILLEKWPSVIRVTDSRRRKRSRFFFDVVCVIRQKWFCRLLFLNKKFEVFFFSFLSWFFIRHAPSYSSLGSCARSHRKPEECLRISQTTPGCLHPKAKIALEGKNVQSHGLPLGGEIVNAYTTPNRRNFYLHQKNLDHQDAEVQENTLKKDVKKKTKQLEFKCQHFQEKKPDWFC